MRRAIELYGRLGEAGLGRAVTVELPASATARAAMSALRAAFGPRARLLDGCVLAGAEDVLSAGDALPRGRLAALPPVCGG